MRKKKQQLITYSAAVPTSRSIADPQVSFTSALQPLAILHAPKHILDPNFFTLS